MYMEPEALHRCAETSSSSTHSEEEDEERLDRLVKTEIEAAETLADMAQLAMREATASDSVGDGGAQQVTTESPTPDSDLSHPGQGQAVAGEQQDEKSATNKSIETKKIRQDDCPRHMEVEQDADLPKATSYSVVRCGGRSRRNLTEEEKEARRIRRVLANRESARQTIRRRQALCEELNKKAANLVLENENLKKEKEIALKEYQSLESTNKHLKAQLAKSINTEAEKTPVEQQESSAAALTTLPGYGPWFLYNHFPSTQIFWPSIIQSSNPVQVQHPPFNSIVIPSNVSIPCSSDPNSYHKQNNPINENQTQNPLYMVHYPWVFPLPEFRNGQQPPSNGLIDKKAELSIGKQCSSSSSLNTVANADCQAALPITFKTEAPLGWTEARSINDSGHTTTRFPLDGTELKTGFQIIGNFHGPSFDSNDHVSAVKQELQLHSAPNPEVSQTASHTVTSSVEKKQEKVMHPGKNLVGAVAAAEARKRRRELTKLRSIQNRQSRMQC